MKTIINEAMDYSRMPNGEINATRYVDFLSGAKFTQCWIPIEEELPEVSVPVLIKTSYNKVATAYITDISKPDYGWTDWMRGQHGYGSVTHWRPIERL